MSTDGETWSHSRLLELLRYFGRHLIAIVIAYRVRDENGDLGHQTHFACLTAFVIRIGQQWYLVTAGHIIDSWRPAFRTNQHVQIVSMSLADYFGIDAVRQIPIPFNLGDQPVIHAWNQREDVDYAVIQVSEALRLLLDQNGVMPLPIDETRTSYDDLYGFGIVGFPEEYCEPAESESPFELAAAVRPVHVPVQYVTLPSPPNRNPVFIADVLDMGNQASINGMSGGPIFGYRMGADGRSQYEVVAIQSQWNGVERIIACPISFAMAEIRSALQPNQEPDEL